MEKKYPTCPFCTSSAVVPDEGFFHCNNCGENFDSSGEIMPQLDDDDSELDADLCGHEDTYEDERTGATTCALCGAVRDADGFWYN